MIPARPSLAVIRAVIVWLAAAILFGMSGLLPRLLPPPLPQALVAFLTLAILTVAVTSQWFRQWLMAVDVRVLVLVHVTRFVAGLSFLVLYGRGELPWAFAVPGGVGDMLVALAALVVLRMTDARAQRARWLVVLWNVLGLIDILMVIATATRLAAVEPGSMAALLRLPLSILPTFLVPIIVSTHVIIFWRLWRRA